MIGAGSSHIRDRRGVAGRYVQLWDRCFRQCIDSDDVCLDPSSRCIRVGTQEVLVLCGGIAGCSLAEGAGVVAVFTESDVGSTVTCAKCDDCRCGGEVGDLYASVKVEEPAVRARGLACVLRTGVQTA